MIKIIGNNELSVAGIKFSLPLNFYIDIEGMETIHQDGLRLMSEEKDCYICFMTTDIRYASAVSSLMDIFMDNTSLENLSVDMFHDNETGYKWIDKPHKCVINNLDCACVKYETSGNYYYEVHFERLEGYDSQLEILLVIPKKASTDVETILARKSIKEFYSSFASEIQ